MEIELSYYKWLLEKAYEYRNNYSQDIYNEVKDSIRTFTREDEKRFPILGNDLRYIMRDGVSIEDTINLLENRIFGILCERRLLEDNYLIKELHDSYAYLGYVKKGLKEYSELDPNFGETVRVMEELLDNYNNGRYDSLKIIYPNLGDILSNDQESLTRKRTWSYGGGCPVFDYNASLIRARLDDFSSFVRKPISNEEIEVQNNFFNPIIKQCMELDSCGNYDNVAGFKHYLVNYDGKDLHVYLNYCDLFVSKNELVLGYPKHYNGEYKMHISSKCNNAMYKILDKICVYGNALSIRKCKKSDIDQFLDNGKTLNKK